MDNLLDNLDSFNDSTLLQPLEVDMDELYRRHRQHIHRRENLTPVRAEECKDVDGNWTKWVKERMTSEQLAKFNDARE